jgi:hypothetical protein
VSPWPGRLYRVGGAVARCWAHMAHNTRHGDCCCCCARNGSTQAQRSTLTQLHAYTHTEEPTHTHRDTSTARCRSRCRQANTHMKTTRTRALHPRQPSRIPSESCAAAEGVACQIITSAHRPRPQRPHCVFKPATHTGRRPACSPQDHMCVCVCADPREGTDAATLSNNK